MTESTATRRNYESELIPTSTHWGNYLVERRNGRIAAVHPYPADPHPSPIGQSLRDAQDPGCRVPQPMIRRGYLAQRWNGDGGQRGREPFVPVSWDRALGIAAEALAQARTAHGNESIFAGSYGWSSAGRFHHAPTQLHRFLNTIGGFAYSKNTYSVAAAENILPHVLGAPAPSLVYQAPTVADMARETGLLVCFGGAAMKNTQVQAFGVGAHTAESQLREMARSGIQCVNVSPVRDDMSDFLNAQWWPCRPNADVAIMLGIAHTLLTEGLHDQAFIDRYCTGFEKFTPYLLGESDGRAKDADWAAALSRIAAEDIRGLARRMAATRTVIGTSWSLQRGEHGEQSFWMATVLASMLGYIGLPGGGVAYGYGCVHNIGFASRRLPPLKVGTLAKGENAVSSFIPVARIADMLLHPGREFDFNGRRLKYPEIDLVYWAGGNPFHHHQDLNRLRQAWSRPATVIVNEPFWTATARHADIVFPCTGPLERNDLGINGQGCFMSPMRQVVDPFGDARNDYDVFRGLAALLGTETEFTEGRDEMQWLEHLYGITRANAEAAGITLPDFPAFWAGEQFTIEDQVADRAFMLERYREDPDRHALRTPSGKIEIYSETIAEFGYDDCHGHPRWYDKQEWLGAPRAGEYPLHLISNQPRTRLHSQLDHGTTSRRAKIKDREAARMHPEDAAARDISDGDVIRLFNDRGACLAGAQITDALRPGVIELATGAWYDPLDPQAAQSLDVHGNPNVLTRDAGTSKLGQGPTAHSCLVQVERFDGLLPPIKAFTQPATVKVEQP